MKAKIKADGREIEVELHKFETGQPAQFVSAERVIYNEYELEFSAPEKAVTSGYLARAKNGSLFLFSHKPKRYSSGLGGVAMTQLPSDTFPSITWESEPRKARIEITITDEKGE